MEYVRKAFDEFAQEYDKDREYIIPEFRQFYGSAVWAADSPNNTPAILDIGAGTGLMSAFLLQKFPDARITLLDFSENMLEIARHRFAENPNIQFIVSDYSHSDLGGSYDMVCSALSIHHLSPEDKQLLFNKIYSALNPGGMFINADQAEGETPYFQDRYQDYWNDFLRNGPLGEKKQQEILKRRKILDRNEKTSLQIQWLCNAGFPEVDLIYKNRAFVVTAAKK